MNQALHTGVLTLVRCALENTARPLPEGFSLEQAVPFLKKHEIEALALEGAAVCGIGFDDPGMKLLRTRSMKCLLAAQRQDAALKALFAAFEQAKIDYLPLKGSVLRSLYPQPELRTMGDADILIRREQYDAIRPVMESLGYTFLKAGGHEITWTSPRLLIELHVDLVPEASKDLYAYFKEPWRLATRQGEAYRHHLSAEQCYLFLFAHFTKHCRAGGAGIRHMVDLWLYEKAFPDMDMAYLRQELEQLQLLDFYDNVLETLQVWFDSREKSDISEVITAHILSGGVFGTMDALRLYRKLRIANPDEKESVGRKLFWNRIFPTADQMKASFPVLKEHIWLLPGCYLWRFVRGAFKPKKVTESLQDAAQGSADELAERKQLMEYMGLDISWMYEK